MIGWYHEYDKMSSSIGGDITNCTMMSWFDTVNDTFNNYIAGVSQSFDFAVSQDMYLFVLVDKESTWQGEV